MTKQQQIIKLREEINTILLDQENNPEKYNNATVYMEANNRIKEIYNEIECLEWDLEQNNSEVIITITETGTASHPQYTLKVRIKRDGKVLDMRSKEVKELNNKIGNTIPYDSNYKSFIISRDRTQENKSILEEISVI